MATLVAVIVFFWKDLGEIISAWWKGIWSRNPLAEVESRIGWWVILGTIPGILAGVLLEETFESFFDNPRAVGGFLLVTALLLVLADIIGKRRRGFAEMNWLDSIIIGIGQAAAISPGISRSGATISMGMYCGLSRETAARFSFILAIPIILGAGLKNVYELFQHGDVTAEAPALIIGFIAAGICGYVAIKFLLAYLRRRRLYPFAAYCLIAGILAIVL
jgi:undecaprenyl-diphosphatase